MKQTEELFKNGYVTSGGGRGKAFVEGTAFATGVHGGGGLWGTTGSGSTVINNYNYNVSSGSSKSTKSSKSSSSSSSAEEFEETIDLIEIAVDRIERAIKNLDTIASSAFHSWAERTEALNKQMVETRNEIDLQQRAYERYMQAANEVGLDTGWVDKIQNGKVDIELITDENLKDKIGQYQEFYEKALDARDAILELKEAESELIQQKFDNVSKKFEGVLGSLEFEQGMIENFIDRAEVDGQIVSKNYYESLKNNVHEQANALREQVKQMIATRDEAVNAGKMQVGDEAWDNMNNEINEITLQIHELGTQWAEFDKAIRETKWKVFDIIQDRISNIASEADFLIELMSNEKLFEDNGQLTDKGMATMGLHGVNYNTYMGQADMYAEEIKKLKEEMEANPLNMDIADRYYELVEAQQEAILSAEESKNAIKDLVEEGIQLELDSLTELIDKYKESLEVQKDLYDYQKKVEEQTKNIADLEKQLSALANDSSEENKAKLQKLKVELESAKDDLEETEYEKFIDDQERLLDEMFDSYSEILNSRLDNIDQLISDMIVEINANSGMISEVISTEANNVGYTLSDQMEQIWSNENSVLTNYGEGFLSSMTNVVGVLNGVRADIQSMLNKIDSMAQDKITESQNSNASNIPVTKPPAQENTNPPAQQQEPPKQITIGGKINAGNARIYADSYGNGGGTQTYRNDPIYTVLSESRGYLLVRHHSLSSGYTGWFKKSDVKAYATGKRKIDDNEYAWTQEDGAEMIMRPSDGAILTPLAKNDSVLTAAASKNIWDMANNPVDFIRENLGIDGAVPTTPNNQQVNYTQNLDKVVFSFPNVQNYNEMLVSMQKDKNFERLVSSMTIDKIAGKSSLAKGKAIR